LSDEQYEAWKIQNNHQQNAEAESFAAHLLGSYPLTMKLTEEQKDIIFQSLYESHHPDTEREYFKRARSIERATSPNRDVASGYEWMFRATQDVLTEEQMEILDQLNENIIKNENIYDDTCSTPKTPD